MAIKMRSTVIGIGDEFGILISDTEAEQCDGSLASIVTLVAGRLGKPELPNQKSEI